MKDRHINRKLGFGGLGSVIEKPQNSRNSVCLLYRFGKKVGILYTVKHRGRLFHTDKKETECIVSTWIQETGLDNLGSHSL